jgi:hypothetical protein
MAVLRGAHALERIRNLVAAGRYRVGLHAVRHMIEEGFDERDLVEALRGNIRMLEEYPAEGRCLVLGRFHFTPATSSALHVLCDLGGEVVLDIVTAYIPHRPWWTTPTQRGRRK